MSVLVILRYAAWILLRAADILLLFRAILSFIPFAPRLYDILYMLTEPIITPFRLLFDKMGWDAPIPIDLPFMLTFVLISVLEAVVM